MREATLASWSLLIIFDGFGGVDGGAMGLSGATK
jgi:hypothetical protein